MIVYMYIRSAKANPVYDFGNAIGTLNTKNENTFIVRGKYTLIEIHISIINVDEVRPAVKALP